MKLFFSNYQQIINIILPVIITGAIFYSDGLEQKISDIQSNYIIDTNTLNNSFIALSINIRAENPDSYQKVKDDLKVQMDKFNKKYEQQEQERMSAKLLQKWIDRLIYTLTLVLIIFNVAIYKRNGYSDRHA